MWRRIREALDTDPSVELVEPVPVSAEALAAADTGPMPLTDTAVIAALRQQIASKDEEIARLSGRRDPGPRTPATEPDVAAIPGGLTSLREYAADLGQRLADATARLRDFERAENTGECVGCLGRQRTIRELRDAAGADRRRIAQLDRALRAVHGAVAHAEAHREIAAEASH